jgi:DNA-binding SARP family transcriptional activator
LAEFRVLGPVEAVVEGHPVPLPAAKPRALLALLLLNRNRVVSVGTLIDELWGEESPETATKALQGYVSQLRKALGADRLLTKSPGYSIRVEEGELDLDRFERLVREGRERLAAGDAEAAAEQLAQALTLWRGPPLDEFLAEPFARDAGARLEDARLAAIEDRIEADLGLGRHGQLVPELEELVRAHPFRERPRGQLMLALYRSGRQAEALELFRRTRETLIEELGIEPGEPLQELERAILRHDPSLEPGSYRPRLDAFPLPAATEGAAPRSRRYPLAIGLALALAAAAATAAALALTTGGSSSRTDTESRAFVAKLENFLTQSREGRRAVSAAVSAAFDCKLAPRVALVRLDRVQSNRQSLLQQVAALSVPQTEDAAAASDLFQKAVQASIIADAHYRDWLVLRTRCSRPDRSPDLRAARAADGRATRAKRRFLAAFDPLARRFHQRVWSAGEF